MEHRRWTVYVLRLREGKYYVGRTTRPLTSRYAEHRDGRDGSTWTATYGVLAVEATFSPCDAFDEDKYTKIYMESTAWTTSVEAHTASFTSPVHGDASLKKSSSRPMASAIFATGQDTTLAAAGHGRIGLRCACLSCHSHKRKSSQRRFP